MSTPEPTAPIPNATAYPVTKKINLTQFIDELETAAGQAVNVTAVGPLQDGEDSVLWIAPAALTSSLVETVIANHVWNPTYGVPSATLAFNAVLQKVLADPEAALTDAEKGIALNGLVLRYNAILSQ